MPAGVLLCLVIAIADGDSLTVRCQTEAGPRRLKVRLSGIDAPESGQPHSRRSRRALAGLCLREQAEIRATGSDHYGRAIAQVRCRGLDVNAAQVHAGWAWVYPRYHPPEAYAILEQDARSDRRGLWADPDPVAPWRWRAHRPQR